MTSAAPIKIDDSAAAISPIPAGRTVAERTAGASVPDEADDESSDGEGAEEAGIQETGLAKKARLMLLDERSFEEKQRRADGDANGADEDETEGDEELLEGFPDNTDDIDISHSRIKTLKVIGPKLERFAPHLRRLCLRQNLIPSLLIPPPGLDDSKELDPDTELLAPLEKLTELRDVDLYDNRLEDYAGVEKLPKLESLDLSFNNIRALVPRSFEALRSLRILYLVQNKISKIKGLEGLGPTLTSLELGGNRIRDIENISHLENLTELWLGKNKITKLEGLGTLRNLKILSIQSNRIVVMEGLDELVALEELYLSHNGVKEIAGLEKNTKLRVLDLSANRLEQVDNISHLNQLEEFWASENAIPSSAFGTIQTQLGSLSELNTVYFEGNPLQRELGASYQRRLKLALPHLIQIDATYVRQA